MTTYQVIDGYIYAAMADGSIGIFSHFTSEKSLESIKCLASNNLFSLEEKPKQESSWFKTLLNPSKNDIEKLNSTCKIVLVSVYFDSFNLCRFTCGKRSSEHVSLSRH